MLKKELSRKTIALFMLVFFASGLFAQTKHTPEPYEDDEFPSWTIDLRRSEIVSLGSLPFVTLGVTIGYSFYRYAANGFNSDYLPNPLAKSSAAANLNSDEQKGIFISSGIISLIIGVVDYVISRIERNRQDELTESERIRQQDSVIVETED
ncbi:MAG: hypothetical protein K5751_09540 [Treponemataceae bacterium]|nr:hypothetical protein [Treponemataceae bacterium]